MDWRGLNLYKLHLKESFVEGAVAARRQQFNGGSTSTFGKKGLPTELVEDPKFVPLNEDDPRFGPPALLLLGFKHEEVSKVQALLKEMDGEFLKVLLYTSDMVKLTLWDAMHVEQEDLKKVKVADGLPRICFLSGLSGEETMMFIDAFPEAGLESTVFAALVPNSAGKSLEELIDEIMGDHERLTGQQQSIKT